MVRACLICALLAVPLAAAATKVRDGAVSARDAERLQALLGDYEGQWNSELISRYPLERPVLRLSVDHARRPQLVFFMDREAARAGDALDLLGFGCRSGVGALLALSFEDPPATHASEPYAVLDATFDFDWGRCPARVHAVAANDLRLRIAVDETERRHVAHLALLRSVRADHRAYVEENGVRREVVVRKKADGRGSVYAPDLEYCVKDDLGEIERCFERESELKRFIVPFPFPGISAAWYTKKTPKVEVEQGKQLLYYEGVFERNFTE